MTLKQIVNELVKEKNYTVKKIAEKTGISEATIRRIKNGKTKKHHHPTTLRIITLYFRIQHQQNPQQPFNIQKWSE